MESEHQPQSPETPASHSPAVDSSAALSFATGNLAGEHSALRWVFVGSQGLRAGWSVILFLALLEALHLIGGKGDFTAQRAFFGELIGFLSMVGAAWIVALVERRRSILDYNLRGPGRTSRFAGGLVAGFVALSALVGSLYLGGWLHFGAQALSGTDILTFAAIWGCAFLLVGCVEEGIMRCFLLFTLARGINFWWALGLVGAMCADLAVRAQLPGDPKSTHPLGWQECFWGVVVMAILGLIPCLALYLKKASGAGFWYAAWVTSTFFGFGHTGNGGENWIGIFAAGAIGFVFCVSVKVTGSAWWAIGCHAAWDWAETYFYGTADSGLVAKGHFLTTSPAGSPFWSGGADGPEGSVLVLGVILLLLAVVLVFYRRGAPAPLSAPALEQAAD